MNTPLALITGASSGIGAIFADRFARRGYDLILVARDAGRLADTAARIRSTTGRAVETHTADLTLSTDRRPIEEILRSNSRIDVLVNDAGFGGVTPLLHSDVDKMENMIAINATALMRLTYAAVPGFVARGRGTIINISSIVAIAPEILNGVYGASKAFVLAFTQSLDHELSDKGVRVQAVLPGATATDFWQVAGRPKEKLPQAIVMTPEDTVDAALAGLDAGEVVTIPPLQDGGEWTRFDAARRALGTKFGHSEPAPRYRPAQAPLSNAA
jgi:short-subunit dehydrogenase